MGGAASVLSWQRPQASRPERRLHTIQIHNYEAAAGANTGSDHIESDLPRAEVVPPLDFCFKNLQTDGMITPRREENFRQSVSYTPKGEMTHSFKYYCPLCMEFFKDILRSSCCGNYTCLRCLMDYVKTKGFVADSVNHLIGSKYLKNISCPHCLTHGFDPRPVLLEDSPRDYTSSSSTIFGSVEVTQLSSPVKVGDTFEDLKRKMIKFQGSSVCASSSSKNNLFKEEYLSDEAASASDSESNVTAGNSPLREGSNGQLLFQTEDFMITSVDLAAESDVTDTSRPVAGEYVNQVISEIMMRLSHSPS